MRRDDESDSFRARARLLNTFPHKANKFSTHKHTERPVLGATDLLNFIDEH